MKLDASWGLDKSRSYHLYRRYPDPMQLVSESEEFRGLAKVWLRPFETALCELVPTGEQPTGARVYEEQTIASFKERSTEIAAAIKQGSPDATPEPLLLSDQKEAGQVPSSLQSFAIIGTVPVTEAGGTLFVSVIGPQSFRDSARYFAAVGRLGDSEIALEPVLGPRTYVSLNWQAWRMNIPANSGPFPFRLNVNAALKGHFEAKAYFIPEMR